MKFEIDQQTGRIKVIPENGDSFSESGSASPTTKTVNGTEVVDFGMNFIKGKKVNLLISVSNKPMLQDAIADGKDIQAKRLLEAEEKRQRELEEDLSLIENAKTSQLPGLLAKIPEGAVRVYVRQIGDADGDAILRYTSSDGTALSWQDVEMVGTAFATRPGALGSFWQERIAYVLKEKIEEIRAEQSKKADKDRAEKQAAEAERESKFSQARESGKPVLLRSWVTARCMNRNDDECSFDRAGEYAMPDGSVKTSYTCCF